MQASVRALIFTAITAALYWLFPAAPPTASTAALLWTVATQLGGPVALALLAFAAARRSGRDDGHAWRLFGVGATLYFFGNVSYLGYAVLGRSPGFPSALEGLFFAMAGFFGFGIARFGRVPERTGTVQLYNFLLIYGAVTIGCLLLLQQPIKHSVLGEGQTIVAFLYPALELF